jgi:hypothetical protein
VEKRTGIGYTVNFARPAAWLFLLGVLAIVLCSLILCNDYADRNQRKREMFRFKKLFEKKITKIEK